MTTTDDHFVIAMSLLPGIGPARLRALLSVWSAANAWSHLQAGTAVRHPVVAAAVGRHADRLGGEWRDAARLLDPVALLAAHAAAGVRAIRRGGDGYPATLRDDPDPPEMLFVRGDLSALDQRTVAIVGTRRCTRYGHDVARRLGRELADAGVAVVSGLAVGIDGAAHEGAFETDRGDVAPIAVVASGLDVVYPPQNRKLWDRVASEGLLVTETPLGVRPDPWRFPARNRIIAALSEAVVVVESAESGGSLHTVDEAARRGIDVLAVPGAVTSSASTGTNHLIADGVRPVLSTADVLDAIGVLAPPPVRATGDHPDPPLDPESAQVLDLLGTAARTLAELAAEIDLPFDRLALAITLLEADGWIARRDGYLERVRWS